MAEGPHRGTSPRRKAPTGAVAQPPRSVGRTPPLCCRAHGGKRLTPLGIGGAVKGTVSPGMPSFQGLPLPLIPGTYFIFPHSPPSTLQVPQAGRMWRGIECPPSHLTEEDTEALRGKVTWPLPGIGLSPSQRLRTAGEALSPCHRDWERSAPSHHEEEEGQHSKAVPSASKPWPVTPNPKAHCLTHSHQIRDVH